MFHVHLFDLHGYFTNSQYDQLPVCLTAQLVEHCIGIAGAMGSRHVRVFKPEFFSGFFLRFLHNCDSLDLSAAVQYIWYAILLRCHHFVRLKSDLSPQIHGH